MSAGERRERPVIAIIGDRFMLPSMFEKALRQKCGEDLEIRSLELPWPDEPMQHGYAEPGMEGLKEYQGDADEVVAHVDGAEIAVTHLAPFSAGILARLPRLRLIAVSRGGPVNIDMDAARERQIRVVNTPGRNASAVAEFTIGAMLAETRLITRGHDSMRRGEWRGDLYRADRTGEELSEMTVGVIGYGHIGTKVVRILKAFGCRILVCDPYVQLSADDLRDGVVQVPLERLLRESDVVTLHARVTGETRGFIGRAQFERDEARRLFRQHGARTHGGLRGADRRAQERAVAGRRARNLRGRTHARGSRVVTARECHLDAPHRRRLGQNGQVRRRGGGGGSSPLPCRRRPAQSLLNDVGGASLTEV